MTARWPDARPRRKIRCAGWCGFRRPCDRCGVRPGGAPVITAALSWLRHLAPPVATGLVREGWCDLIGFGRSAFAYPDAPNDILRGGGMVPGKCCVTCSMCSQIMKDGVGRGGCVVRDSAVYAPEYRRGRDAARQTMVARKL